MAENFQTESEVARKFKVFCFVWTGIPAVPAVAVTFIIISSIAVAFDIPVVPGVNRLANVEIIAEERAKAFPRREAEAELQRKFRDQVVILDSCVKIIVAVTADEVQYVVIRILIDRIRSELERTVFVKICPDEDAESCRDAPVG